MIRINLKKLISKKEVSSIINDISNAMDTSIGIRDVDGRLLIGNDNENPLGKYPVKLTDEVIGWVIGGEKAAYIASLLTYLAGRELEKKTLAYETLDVYKEITLLYDIAEKMSSCLEVEEVARLVIDEARRSIAATSASVMLLNEDTGKLEIISAFGEEYDQKTTMREGEGIAGNVVLSRNAEIINDVLSDPRYVKGANKVSSLICAPLKTKDKVIGVINISSEEPANYTARDLKLFTALASQAASAIENATLHENKLKEERIKSNLERYIAPQVVKAIIESKEDISLNSEKRNIAILFSDIRNFSSTCEELGPEDIVRYLNEYFTYMVEIIFSNKGTVNKFVGDMIVALFGAPARLNENEKLAIEAAIKMQECIKAIPHSWIRENFNTGIGINSGEVVVGNIGSPQHMDYTAIGDGVNIAERLQSIAKGDQILVSRSVYDITKDTFEFKKSGKIKVKGKKKPIEAFEVVY